ncbi:MAG: adenosine deaminase [Acidimicrobiales bacterium]|jgi:adenosine deaminase
MNPTLPTDEWIRGLPKAEVHLHLEGCLPHDMVRRAAERAGAPRPSVAGEEAAKITSLSQLLAYLDWSCALIDRADQLEQVAYDITTRAVQSGARHVDVIVNPTHWPHWQARLGDMLDALDGGFRAGQHDNGTTSALCVSLNRNQSRSEALEVVDTLLELRHPRVAALSIDGNESDGRESNNSRFAPAFERARAGGLRRCAHAGESSGAKGVREAIELLGAERIDHGIRCLEDPRVTALVATRGVPLDVCPTSNVVLGVVGELASHPIKELRARGVRCSLNTDDPLLYDIDLAGEYARVAGAFGWGNDELGQMARVGVESCFSDEDRRFALLKRLDDYLGR